MLNIYFKVAKSRVLGLAAWLPAWAALLPISAKANTKIGVNNIVITKGTRYKNIPIGVVVDVTIDLYLNKGVTIELKRVFFS